MKNSTPMYIATIGLEIHAELKTASKMFCSCKNDPDEERPNVNICPICLGHPGTLPVLNKQAIKNVLQVGYAVGGEIADFTEWDRKNYFYPDLPKGYQISQYKYPLVVGGQILGVKITRVHLEEDTAQSTHDTHDKSLINFNRSGVPLMELVTEPVIHDAETAVNFAKELQLLLRYLGVGEANMEKGEMRVEASISIATPEDTAVGKLGTKNEIKNLNSFKVVEKAIEYEIERQTKILERGEKVMQETRGWDENGEKTFSQRAKESSHDYRYFPEPDIPKLKISQVEEFEKNILMKEAPELPWDKRERFTKDYEMTAKEVAVFIETPEISKYFEEVLGELGGEAGKMKMIRLTTNYILTDYLGLLKKDGKNPEKFINTISPKNFAKLITITEKNILSSRGAKDVLAFLLIKNDDPENIAKENNLLQKSDRDELLKIVRKIIESNSGIVDEYKKGKIASLEYLVGQGMRETKGSANPAMLRDIIIEIIG